MQQVRGRPLSSPERGGPETSPLEDKEEQDDKADQKQAPLLQARYAILLAALRALVPDGARLDRVKMLVGVKAISTSRARV